MSVDGIERKDARAIKAPLGAVGLIKGRKKEKRRLNNEAINYVTSRDLIRGDPERSVPVEQSWREATVSALL